MSARSASESFRPVPDCREQAASKRQPLNTSDVPPQIVMGLPPTSILTQQGIDAIVW
jgi:hypothetical protein